MTPKRSLREAERRLEDLEGPTEYGNLPTLSLATLICSEEIEAVDEERGVYRVDGQLMRDTISSTLMDQLRKDDS